MSGFNIPEVFTVNGVTYRRSDLSSGYAVANFDSSIAGQLRASSTDLTGNQGTSITSQIVDGICEGEIEGWPTSNPAHTLKYVYLDGTPALSYESQINTGDLRLEFNPGRSDQVPLSNYTLIGSVKTPNFQAEIINSVQDPPENAIIQQVQIRDDTDGAYPPVEGVAFTFVYPEGVYRFTKRGSKDTTPTGIRIEVNRKTDNSAPWIKCIEDDFVEQYNSSFERTYVVELPQGWSTAKGLQQYGTEAAPITDYVDDIISFRISKFNQDLSSGSERRHSKVYLKSYSILTRNQFSYPYTALAGITIDSKNFDGSIPRRQYDLKLLKVKVPSNYNIITDSKTGKIVERNYSGNWDGTFKTVKQWTDNPVWCFYDLITNTRYGLGNYIDSTLLDKWKLYEIAKYCDAVVPDTRGGAPANSYTFSAIDSLGGVASGSGPTEKEPRFTCNVFISSREEAYSLVQKFASLFRAITFFQHGSLAVIQDKAATPVYLYNNTNVIGGVFSYASSGAKARHTVAAVRWVDPDDLYTEKVEYVEDYDGISRYGYREIEIDGFGCTSRGQARRLGRHILITEKFELETISFKVGMEGGIVTPGNLIKIKDSYRQVKRAGGRILSATSNTINLDTPIDIPSGVLNIKLWVETPKALSEIIEGSPTISYKPTLTSHDITSGPGSNGLTSLQIIGSFSTTPSSGNLWALSYDISSSIPENNSIYRVISVSENNSYEYEITALQHYSKKYESIDAYEPIPQYAPRPFNFVVNPPDRGWITSSKSDTSGKFNIKVEWQTDNYISGTVYRVSVIENGLRERELIKGTSNTNYSYTDAPPGVYYFKIFTLNKLSGKYSLPLILGPYITRESLPQNSFSAFNQTGFTDKSVVHTWNPEAYSAESISYELWRNISPELRTLVSSNTISGIKNNNITLNNFSIAGLSSPEKYRLEVPIYPYVKYTATNVTSQNTSPATVILSTREKISVSVGDKLLNSTRNTGSSPTFTNIISTSQTKQTNGLWTTILNVNPSVSSQASGDIIYYSKGVLGIGLVEILPSATIGQKSLLATTNTSPASIYSSSRFANVNTGDFIINRTRSNSSAKVTKISNSRLDISPIISGQTVGDRISFYQNETREPRATKKFKIDFQSVSWGGDVALLKNITDAASIGIPDETIVVNLTKSKSAELSAVSGNRVAYWPTIGSADNDEIIFLPKSEVFTSSIATHIHPTGGFAEVGTSPLGIVSTGLFTTASPGDIVVNATRNTSRVIGEKINNNQINLVAAAGSPLFKWKINEQTTGDMVFVVKSSDIANTYNEYTRYEHPTIYTTSPTTNTTTITATGAFSGVTTSYRVYNLTRNVSATISSATVNTLTVSPAITGQTSGDLIYTFLPTEVTNTIVTAPDGAFKDVRQGDTFWNITRDKTSLVSGVSTLTGSIDKKIDRLILATEISPQAAGDSFIIYQGWRSAVPLSFTDNGTNDRIKLEDTSGFSRGDRVYLYSMRANNLGIVNGTSFIDTGLSPAVNYYYWMRAVNSKAPTIVGQWLPNSTTGDLSTTLPSEVSNYNTSNDNNSEPITIKVSRISPGIDLPSGGRNSDSTANIRLLWEWTGRPRDLDGFVVYFWSSNSTTDDNTIDADDDYTRFSTNYVAPVNSRVGISSLSYSGTTVTVNTNGPHKLSIGDKVRLGGVKNTAGGDLANVNNLTSAGTDFFIASPFSNTGFRFTAGSTPVGTHSPGTGTVTSCEYTYQINNLTANYFYNAWIQPYRMVNTTISENGILVGSPVRLYI